MKRFSVVMAAVAVIGVVLAGVIPALGQEGGGQAPVTESTATCPYHDQAEMVGEGMDEWMDSPSHDAWMKSAAHTRRHDSMEETGHMTTGRGIMNPGNMTSSGTAIMMNSRYDR